MADRPSPTTRWKMAKEKWEYTWTFVKVDPANDGKPDPGVAGVPLHANPEGKECSTWMPFSVTPTNDGGGVLVWWRRATPDMG